LKNTSHFISAHAEREQAYSSSYRNMGASLSVSDVHHYIIITILLATCFQYSYTYGILKTLSWELGTEEGDKQYAAPQKKTSTMFTEYIKSLENVFNTAGKIFQQLLHNLDSVVFSWKNLLT
jgi:hypothetical protein